MIKYLNHLFLLVATTLSLFCTKDTTDNVVETEFDWNSYLSKPSIELQISNNNISIFSMKDSTFILPLALDWPAKDSLLLNDSGWINCKTQAHSSCSGNLRFYTMKKDVPFPHNIILKCLVNRRDTMYDTINFNSISGIYNSLSFSSIEKDSLFNYSINWNSSLLDTIYGLYMTIALDNGLFGAEYYYSYPNYNNLPELDHFEGYRYYYGQFNPKDNHFSFNSRQDLKPIVRFQFTVKQYKNYDLRICLN